MTSYPQIEPVSESLLVVRLGTEIDLRLNAAVHRLAGLIRRAQLRGIVDIAPAYASVAVRYQPGLWRNRNQNAFAALAAALMPLLDSADTDTGAPRRIEIPVCYGGDFGIDLESAAQSCRLASMDFIRLHASADYRVAMLGFAPGFPYLLGLPTQLHLPRRAQPRLQVPPGSVAVGGAQTGIYPNALPGGWHLIGRTPLRLFDASADEPCVLAAGDAVRFRCINVAEFNAWTDEPIR